ncbi:MAG: hypothetical protein K8T90_21835 [Planctomycetes bacterium]|nr:hypothetical protein [Planctomycetota bacterium]
MDLDPQKDGTELRSALCRSAARGWSEVLGRSANRTAARIEKTRPGS